MSLWSNLLKTYDGIESSTGIVPFDEEGNPQVKKALLPLFHMTFPTKLQISLDAAGNCIGVTRDAQDVTIIAPCTESSMGRAGKDPAPHPLCDQLQYIDSTFDKKKFSQYMGQLGDWKGGNVKLNAIFAYLSQHSLISDACDHGIYERNEDGSVALPKGEEKAGVRFSVRDLDSSESNVWEDKTLWQRWIAYETGDKPAKGRDSLGGIFRSQAANYPKNIVGTAGNAKLVSANDNSNFTFRGRFSSQAEASRIDSITSQKAHAALKWLVNNNGTITDKQAIVIWAVGQRRRIPLPFGNSYVVEQATEAYLTDTEILSRAKSNTDTDYARKFGALVRGFGSAEQVKNIQELSSCPYSIRPLRAG
ncbi:type I-C CRISPR-associated protein Cas8c/Csd1 [Bifidobacterium sp. ESL0682]|uniref:type I-C CRISPR-associated protein Cas8c/Csd1 n=1 Tax=Bifidobacterium sp. ESL0682 TaxID=2983212 RepID=UPI0023F76BE2|nr:type I-C CRISPR-associated protein Cas8c/Csd1 [Bifidobacterium sp. ESL0682]WEV41498.1 type I-C CRISPR-associated protein Cas8c/Csd1 [Bifidobacterium sp. ESL0682]